MKRRAFVLGVGASLLAPRVAIAGMYTGLESVRALFLASSKLDNQVVIDRLSRLIQRTELNAIVVDIKEGRLLLDPHHLKTLERFKSQGAYVIGRFVTFQDSVLAKDQKFVVRNSNGTPFLDGKPSWDRRWVDPSLSEVQDYNIKLAKQVIDSKLIDELNFDYIRFPHNEGLIYPGWKNQSPKHEVMNKFFGRLRHELKTYSPKITISIDVYGEVYLYGGVKNIGQRLGDIAKYFDVLCPMSYPSHYSCNKQLPSGAILTDPTIYPEEVVSETIAAGLKTIANLNPSPITRPWIEDFPDASIYGCFDSKRKDLYYAGSHTPIKGPKTVEAQIRALEKQNIRGFMIWNPAGDPQGKALRSA